MYDVAGLIVPRVLFVENGISDPIFPVDSTRFAMDRARELFRVFGAEDRVRLEMFDGATCPTASACSSSWSRRSDMGLLRGIIPRMPPQNPEKVHEIRQEP